MCLFTQISIPGTSPGTAWHTRFTPLCGIQHPRTYWSHHSSHHFRPHSCESPEQNVQSRRLAAPLSDWQGGRKDNAYFSAGLWVPKYRSVSSCPSAGCLYRCIIITLSRTRKQAVRTENEDDTGGNRYSVCSVTPWKHESKPMAAPRATCLSGKPELL